MTAWTTPSEAAALIGSSTISSQANVDMAAAIVESFINREVEDIPNIAARDLRRIQKAIAWQAMFLVDQPDYTYMTLVETVTTDGQTFQMAKKNEGRVFEAAQLLHPIAIRELKNLTWKHLPAAPLKESTYDALSFLDESSDNLHSWRELS